MQSQTSSTQNSDYARYAVVRISFPRYNLSERLLRGIAVTRKNFLFLGSDKGGERA